MKSINKNNNVAHVVNQLSVTSSVLDQIHNYDINRYNQPHIIIWNDERLKIKWPKKNFILSSRDK